CFGWLGLTAGSTLSGTDLRLSVIVVNTVLAAAAGAVASMLVMWWKFGKPDPSLMCNGLVAGLVAITAACAFVGPTAAVFIGAVAGVLVVFGVFFWDRKGVDDPIGAISMHGVNGAWGLLAVGLFANGQYGKNFNGVAGPIRGLFYGDARQLLAQVIALATLVGFGYLMAWAWFRFSNRIFPLRTSREAEYQGLDIPEMGALGYSDFMLKASHSVSEIPMSHR
ncbi:MAG: ammonium transporter, partial [Phycisphaerae bacterium]